MVLADFYALGANLYSLHIKTPLQLAVDIYPSGHGGYATT